MAKMLRIIKNIFHSRVLYYRATASQNSKRILKVLPLFIKQSRRSKG
jgi:hypothetical protein